MILRMKHINPQIQVAMLSGSESWIDNSVTEEMKEERPQQFTVHTVRGAGHHVYADKPNSFNELVNGIFEKCDKHMIEQG